MTPEGVACLHLYFQRIVEREWAKYDGATAYVCAMRGTRYSQARMDAAHERWMYVLDQYEVELRRLL